MIDHCLVFISIKITYLLTYLWKDAKQARG